MKSNFQRNFDQIGGRWAISLKAGIAIFPIFVMCIPILESSITDAHIFWGWAAISLAASIPACIFLYLGHLTYFRNRSVEPKPPISVFTLGFLIGSIKGLILEILALKFGLVETSNYLGAILIRTLNSAILSAVSVSFIALFLVTTDNFRSEKRELLSQLAFAKAKKTQISNLGNTIRTFSSDELSKYVNQLLESTKKQFRLEQSKSPINYEALAQLLNDAAENIIRPLSHTLYQQSKVDLPKLNLSQTLRLLSKSFRLEISAILIAYDLFTFKNLFVNYGLQQAVFILFWRTCLFGAILLIFSILAQKISTRFQNAFLLASVGSVMTFVSADSLLSPVLHTSTDSGKFFLSIIWNLIVVIALGFLFGLTDVNRQQIDSIKRQIKIEDTSLDTSNLETRLLYKNLSKVLHSVYHTRLIACAIAISMAGKDDDIQTLRYEIDRAILTLDLNFDDYLKTFNKDFNASILELSEKWSGTLELKFFQDLKSAPSYFQLIGLNEFLSEALSNSFRHGRASAVSIEISSVESGAISVRVLDNGVGYIPSTPGLGSAIFDEISQGSWSITSQEDLQGALTTIVIPLKENK